MAYDIILEGATVEIRLAGELTFAQHRKFRQVVANIEQTTPAHVTFDLSRVEYIDAAGLGLLLVARDAVSNKGGRSALAGAQGQVGRMLAVARFSDIFNAA
ncbi:MAG TPA: STAS domain-containing protein [Candidatus Omnitrophota bacterium]|nr:STAS domain-containing protein [Candidatus Omnitrophota bacterium]